MMRALFAGVSGMKNHQTRMDVIGNNIANINTIGFKGSRVNFQDELSQTIQSAAGATANRGGVNPTQVGLGMGLASIDTLFTDGSLQSTGKMTDLAISGSGFFILSDGNETCYTRAGAFDFDTQGNFVVPGSGLHVMGWMADASGKLVTNGAATAIQIPVGQTMTAKPTTYATYSGNLSADAKERVDGVDQTWSKEVTETLSAAEFQQKFGVAATAVTGPGAVWKYNDPTTPTKVEGFNFTAAPIDTATPPGGGPYTVTYQTTEYEVEPVKTPPQTDSHPVSVSTDGVITDTNIQYVNNLGGISGGTAPTGFVAKKITNLVTTPGTMQQAPVTVFDSQGKEHKISGYFENVGVNTWKFHPGAPLGAKNYADVTDYEAAVKANQAKTDTGWPLTGGDCTLVFNNDGTIKSVTSADGSAGSVISFTPSGADPVTVQLNFNSPTRGLTQFSGSSDAQLYEMDGYRSGTLNKTAIDANGVITGGFDNGQSLTLGQVALATFNNPAGLTKLGDNIYIQSNNSGEAQVGMANTGGRGGFSAGRLEMSNVDLATEFSNMIITERGFQANSKIITTTDEMLQELTNLKR